MPLQVRIKSVERLLFQSDLVAVGSFRCPADHPLFVDSGPCSNHTFAFPRTNTAIRHASGDEFTGGPNTISIYNEGQRYTRSAVDPLDSSDWYAVADDLVTDAISGFESRPTEKPGRRFRHTHAPADARLYFDQRALFTALERGEQLDRSAVEESVIRFLGHVLRAAYRTAPRRRPSRDAVEETKRIIASNAAKQISLRELAARVEVSPYQLCRDFRSLTGITMTRFRHSLRLRMALERLDRSRDLTDLALDLGYSSHSHFTYAFRREFGVPPSEVRGARASNVNPPPLVLG